MARAHHVRLKVVHAPAATGALPVRTLFMNLKSRVSQFFAGLADRPVVTVYVRPAGDTARPEGRATNPLMLRGLFIS